MAGRKQHFIPRHFLKEFVAQDESDTLWMYRRGKKKPVAVSRYDAAATRDFYSKPVMVDTPTLDDLITDYEKELKFLVDRARSTPAGGTLPADLISEIVVHLTIRAAYLREFIETGANKLVASIDALIHRPSDFLEGAELPRHRVPSKFESVAIEQLEEHMLSSFTSVTPKSVARLLYQAIRENYNTLKNKASKEFTEFLKRFQEEIRTIPQNIHVRLLEENLVPEPRKARLEEFQWRVIGFLHGNAVLPDCVAIAEDAEGWGPYVLADNKSISRVVLPLTSSTLAVGSAANDWSEVAETYNQTARDSCFTFYLQSQREEVDDSHLAELGNSARTKIETMTSSALRKAVEEFVGNDSPPPEDRARPVTWTDLSGGHKFSYSVAFVDFGDEAYAQRVAASLNEAVKIFCGIFPIHSLDGITFADDYAAAIKGLDRGPNVAQSVPSFAGTNPNGVGMPIVVRRSDGIKTHIVLRGYIAEQLISEDPAEKGDAISIICYCLGTTAFNLLLDAKFPETLLAPPPDQYEGWLYKYNEALLATYFSTRLLCPTAETLSFYSEQALLQLAQMISVTADAHSQYQDDGDHEHFFEISATQVSGFMTTMTRFFATRASMIGPQRTDELLDQALARLELLNWSKLFAEDLEAFNRRFEDWADQEEMYFLNRHLERLLLEVGVFPDQMSDGSLYIHTSREHRLASRK